MSTRELASDREPAADWSSRRILDRLRLGEDRAAAEVLDRYLARLTALARRRLSARVAQRADPEDIVQSALRSFFVGARAGRFDWQRGGDLWRLLAAITRHKGLHRARRELAECRTVDREVALGAHDPAIPDDQSVADLTEELDQIAEGLNPFARQVLELRLRGEPLATIAESTGRAERSVRRALATIRDRFAARLSHE